MKNMLYKFSSIIQKVDLWNKMKKILPTFLFKAIWYLYAYTMCIFSWERKFLKKNKELKWIAKGKRAFILATWPSIKKENLKLLEWEDCFSVSNFFLHDDIEIINPKFQFFIPFHRPLILENYIEWLKLADNTLPKNTNIVLWSGIRNIVEENGLFKWRKVFYLYLKHYINFSSNITFPIYHPATWPQMIIPVLMYMWYKEIYLLWCDHNTLRDYWWERKDFYDTKKDVRKNAKIWSSFIDFLENQLLMFKDYEKIKKIAKKKWIKIINLSEDSRLECFKKDTLKNIINK